MDIGEIMIRLADIKDIDELCDLRVSQQKDDWDDEYEDKFDLYHTTKKYLEKHLNKDVYLFLNIADGKIVATCGLQIIEYLPQCNDNGRYGFIFNVFTLREYRRKGLQYELIEKVIKFAKERELCEISLSSDSDDAIKLYKKFGFEFDDLMMKLEIK